MHRQFLGCLHTSHWPEPVRLDQFQRRSMPLRLIVRIDPLDAWLRGSCHLHWFVISKMGNGNTPTLGSLMVKRINHEIWDAVSNKSGLRPPNQNGPWAVGFPCFAPTLNFAQALLGGKLRANTAGIALANSR